MVTEEEKSFLAYVKAHRHLGYGRMMQIISYAWYTGSVAGSGVFDQGAQITSGCVAFMDDHERHAYEEILFREVAQGMPY